MTLVVGVTGNIASGKSTVAARFARHGAALIDADVLARRALEPGTPGLAAVSKQWPGVITPDGSLNRAALRRIVFGNPGERERLNAIVHPEVGRLREIELATARARGEKFVVYDVPLLFEAGLERTVDIIVLVDASEHLRRERLEQRGLSATEADAMIAAQMPASLKRARAHFVIDNNGDRAALLERADFIWNTLARGTKGG
jgi:dephospho-CoA kinase